MPVSKILKISEEKVSIITGLTHRTFGFFGGEVRCATINRSHQSTATKCLSIIRWRKGRSRHAESATEETLEGIQHWRFSREDGFVSTTCRIRYSFASVWTSQMSTENSKTVFFRHRVSFAYCFTGFTRYLEEYVLVSVGERNMRSRYNEFFRHDMMRIHLMGWKNARCGHDHLFRQIVFVVHAPRGLSASCPQLYFFCQRWDLS